MTPGVERPGGRRLVLLRHAQAEHTRGVADELRPLTLVGRRQCLDIGARLAAAGLVPEQVLVSSALRAHQTWELVRGALGDVPAPDVDVDDRLYGAGVSDVTERVRLLDDRLATVLVVGHEPTMSSAASALASRETSAADQLARVHGGLSTGAFAVLEVGSWVDLAPGVARLVTVVRPTR